MRTTAQNNVEMLLVILACTFIPFITSQMEQCPNSPRPVKLDDFNILVVSTANNSYILENKRTQFAGFWLFKPPKNINILTEMVTIKITYHLGHHKPICSLHYKPFVSLVESSEDCLEDKYLPKDREIAVGVNLRTEKCSDYKAGEKGILEFQLIFDGFGKDGLCAFTETEVVEQESN